jgi:rubrerythrin
MTVSEPKKRMNKDQIIEVLRRNARLFKDEPEFVTYIVDLAIYLIENYLESGDADEKAKRVSGATFRASDKELKEMYRLFDRFATGKTPAKTCPMCGCAVEGKRKCPNCDAMTF